jgi:hypothetical protein
MRFGPTPRRKLAAVRAVAASDIKVGAQDAGVDGLPAAGSRVSYWYESTKQYRKGKSAEKPPELQPQRSQ